eukprot:6016535-Amphidinium_carterae.1
MPTKTRGPNQYPLSGLGTFIVSLACVIEERKIATPSGNVCLRGLTGSAKCQQETASGLRSISMWRA